MAKSVLLINSYNLFDLKNRYIPLGLMYIASSLLKSGYTVKLKDLQNEISSLPNWEEKEIDNYFSEFAKYLKIVKPDFIGISVMFSGRFKPALKVAKMAKKIFKDIPIVLGGGHPTLFPKPILEEYAYIDYIVLGEGDQSIVKLLQTHFNDKNLLSGIDGIAYRKNGRVIISPKKEFIKDLDKIPFPAHELINIKDYYFDTSDWHNPKKMRIDYNFPITTSRGCPRRCTYCALSHFHGQKYRMRSAKNVVDEIQYLYDNYNCRYVSFVDDNMAVSKKRVLEIMSEICKRKLNIQFDTSQGLEINTIDEEMLDAMVKAGFIRTALGIETGSEYLRNGIIKKNLTNERIHNFFKMASRFKDLRFVGFFICGFPQETKETLDETFEMIKKYPLDNVNITNLFPFYGTEMFKYCCENGLLKVDTKNLHNVSASFGGDFLIKPFNLDTSYIDDFRNRIYAYVEKRKRERNKG